jgi:hypothetical protein
MQYLVQLGNTAKEPKMTESVEHKMMYMGWFSEVQGDDEYTSFDHLEEAKTYAQERNAIVWESMNVPYYRPYYMVKVR